MRNDIDEFILLKDLVAFKSVTPEHAGSLDYIAKIIEQLGGGGNSS